MVRMPKLKLEFSQSLKESLQALGMAESFDDARADFSAMCAPPTRLFISDVKHKSFVLVNEEGTEAAAVTSTEMKAVSMPEQVIIDRPYLMIIRERLSGTIFFLGLIVDPTLAS